MCLSFLSAKREKKQKSQTYVTCHANTIPFKAKGGEGKILVKYIFIYASAPNKRRTTSYIPNIMAAEGTTRS